MCDESSQSFKPDVVYRIDPGDAESIDNWYTTLGLICKGDDTAVDFLWVCLLAGFSVGMVVFPIISDKLGRKKTFLIGLILHAMLGGTILILKEVTWFYSVVFLMGMEHPARFIVGYIYISELCTSSMRPLFSTAALFCLY